jgi:hypothetical protein
MFGVLICPASWTVALPLISVRLLMCSHIAASDTAVISTARTAGTSARAIQLDVTDGQPNGAASSKAGKLNGVVPDANVNSGSTG